MTAFENNRFNNRPRLTDPFNPLLRELLGPPLPIERIAAPQLRLAQGDMLVHAQGGGGPTTEAGILRQRGEEFAAAIVGQGRLGPADNRGISEQEGVELTLMLLNRIHQINTAAGAQPGSMLARQRINAFIEGINRHLHLAGLDLRVDPAFNNQGAVNVTQALLFRWQNDMRNGDSIGRAHIPQAREQEITQLRDRANTFAQEIVSGNRLPANGSVVNQNWLTTQLNTHLGAIGTGQGGANRIRLFLLHLAFALRRDNHDVDRPSVNQIRFYPYDNQDHCRRGLPETPLLTVQIPAEANNPGNGGAPEQGGEQQTIEQRIAALINQNWENTNNEAADLGVGAQFFAAYGAHGRSLFVDRLNLALAGNNRSVAFDEHFEQLVLYNGVGNGRVELRRIDATTATSQARPSLATARELDRCFTSQQHRGRLLEYATNYAQRRGAIPLAQGGPQAFDDAVNLLLGRHRRAVVYVPTTGQFSLHSLGEGNAIVNPPIATVEVPANQRNGPPPMPPVIDQVAAQEAARQLATLINSNWQNGNNDSTIVTQFQTGYRVHGGQEFVTRLNQVLAGQSRSVSYDESTGHLVLYNGTGQGRTEQRRVNAPTGDDPLVTLGRWIGGLCCGLSCLGGSGAAAFLAYYLYQRMRNAIARNRLEYERITAERAERRGVVPSMRPVDGTTHTSNQEVREPTHVFSRSYPQQLLGNTPEERQTDLNNRLTTLRQQHQGNPFLGDTVLENFHSEASTFSGRLRTMITFGQAATPDARAAEFQQFIRDFISAHDTQFTLAQREFFSRMVVTHSAHTGTGNALATASIETHGGHERLHIELPTQLLTGDMSTLQMHEVCGSIFDACFRSEVVRNLPQSEVGNVTRLNEIRMAGNTLAYYVEHNLALTRTEGEQAHQARINFHSSRQTVLLAQRTIEFNSNGEMIMRGPGGVVMNESAMREAERSLITSEIEALRRRLAEPNLSNTERASLQAQLDQRLRWQEQMRVTGENQPNDTTRNTAHTEFRRSLHERYNHLSGRHGGSRVAWGMLLNAGLLLLYNAIPER